MDTMLQRFFYHKAKVAAFGAVAIVVSAFVLVFLYGISKHLLGLVYLHANLWQVAYLQGRAILVYQVLQIHAIKLQVVVFYLKAVLGKVKSLVNKV
jgi:hypothetical protein